VGVPFPKGALSQEKCLTLFDPEWSATALQTSPLAHWSDGSIKWLLLDFVARSLAEGPNRWSLRSESAAGTGTSRLRIEETPKRFTVDTGAETFALDKRQGLRDTRILLTDDRGNLRTPRFAQTVLEAAGPVRATVRLDGEFRGRAPCRIRARLCFFAGTGLVRIRLTIHNPRRAQHRGGLWDLGDPGSILFRDLTLEATLPGAAAIHWKAEPGEGLQAGDASPLEIFQASSGGENWCSRNHVNRHGQVPCPFRGYRIRKDGKEWKGLRASPVVSVEGPTCAVAAAVPEFWEQFPKAVEADDQGLRVRLFPAQYGDLFELQGGEQKTHTVWLHFGKTGGRAALDWVQRAAVVHCTPEWYSESGALGNLPPAEPGSPLETYLQGAVEGSNSLLARREIIDEYGWRNYGEVYADHENAYYEGDKPVISHFNNQYDMVYGTLLRYFRTGDCRWFGLLDPLARHVMDIDIYHTTQDKAAYNGGLFWLTDHYKDAHTCTHRTYSRANREVGSGSYGGGPSSSHNFAAGLLYYYYHTGDPNARDSVLGLANWVVAMDDGTRTVLGVVEDGPTGFASATPIWHFQGPDRGAGLSIRVLLDAWTLAGQRVYLDKAEELIRRCIHPEDDVESYQLLDIETHWGYTVFLSSLAHYLDVKAEASELDFMYAYGRASLLHYASWMLANEVPYLLCPEKLQYPTETWAAQEFRKANVLRHAAAHAEEPLRSRFLRRGHELADRAWTDLGRFETRAAARALAIVIVEGTHDSFYRYRAIPPAPRGEAGFDFGQPAAFVPQRQRVRAQLRTASGLVRAAVRLADPRRWFRYFRKRSS
jgi:hypothetical protein